MMAKKLLGFNIRTDAIEPAEVTMTSLSTAISMATQRGVSDKKPLGNLFVEEGMFSGEPLDYN